jgi:LysM repeat protein
MAGTFVLMAFVALAVVLLGSRAGNTAPRHAATRVYQVRAGDTLWRIASRVAGPEGDPRPVVDRVIELNGLHGASIWAGERLYLPSQ